MAWDTKDHSGSIGNSQMCIITGPNFDIATKLIRRLKNILITKRPYSDEVVVLVKVFQERNLVHHRLKFRYNEDMSLCMVAGPILKNDLQLYPYQHKILSDIYHFCTWA